MLWKERNFSFGGEVQFKIGRWQRFPFSRYSFGWHDFDLAALLQGQFSKIVTQVVNFRVGQIADRGAAVDRERAFCRVQRFIANHRTS